MEPSFPRCTSLVLALVATLGAPGCSSTTAAPADSRSGTDTGVAPDVGQPDSLVDGAPDTAIDAPADGIADGGLDGGSDADACTDACTAGAKRCGTAGVETCAAQANGCLGWGAGVACPTGNVCSSNACQFPTQIVAGRGFACALLSDQTVRCWGSNNSGQLGIGAGANSKTPIAVPGVSGVKALAAGYAHVCAVTAGAVTCWGRNTYGELGVTPFGPSAKPAAVPGVTTAVDVSAGDGGTCARLASGTMTCWGRSGVLGNGSTADSGTPTGITGFTNILMTSVGSNFACEVDTNLRARCWGSGSVGQTGTGAGMDSPFPAPVAGLTFMGSDAAVGYLTSGNSHTCVLTASNGPGMGVMCWGRNDTGQVGDGTMGAMNRVLSAMTVSGLASGVDSVAAGGSHSCVVQTTTGGVRCWGENVDGELGDGTRTNSATPVTVSGLGPAVSLALGFDHTCALLKDHTIWCWGANDTFQLGATPPTSGSRSPVAVSWQ